MSVSLAWPNVTVLANGLLLKGIFEMAALGIWAQTAIACAAPTAARCISPVVIALLTAIRH